MNVEVCLGLGGRLVLRHTFPGNAIVGGLQAQLKDVLGEVALQKIGRFVIAQDAGASHAGFKNDEKDACTKCFGTAGGRRAHMESNRTGRRVVITGIVERRVGLLILVNWPSSVCLETEAPVEVFLVLEEAGAVKYHRVEVQLGEKGGRGKPKRYRMESHVMRFLILDCDGFSMGCLRGLEDISPCVMENGTSVVVWHRDLHLVDSLEESDEAVI